MASLAVELSSVGIMTTSVVEVSSTLFLVPNSPLFFNLEGKNHEDTTTTLEIESNISTNDLILGSDSHHHFYFQ